MGVVAEQLPLLMQPGPVSADLDVVWGVVIARLVTNPVPRTPYEGHPGPKRRTIINERYEAVDNQARKEEEERGQSWEL